MNTKKIANEYKSIECQKIEADSRDSHLLEVQLGVVAFLQRTNEAREGEYGSGIAETHTEHVRLLHLISAPRPMQ